MKHGNETATQLLQILVYVHENESGVV